MPQKVRKTADFLSKSAVFVERKSYIDRISSYGCKAFFAARKKSYTEEYIVLNEISFDAIITTVSARTEITIINLQTVQKNYLKNQCFQRICLEGCRFKSLVIS